MSTHKEIVDDCARRNLDNLMEYNRGAISWGQYMVNRRTIGWETKKALEELTYDDAQTS